MTPRQHSVDESLPLCTTEQIARCFAQKLGLDASAQITIPLRQAWLEAREPSFPSFQPSTAIFCPRSESLDCVVAMSDTSIFNQANGFNQQTWRLGDVVELFIAPVGSENYWELHLTPNNHRLQLQWTKAALDSFRSGAASIDSQLISDTRFFSAQAFVDKDKAFWVGHFSLPWRSISLPLLRGSHQVEAAICRCDTSVGIEGVTYSATAPFTKANFHAREHWDTFTFHA